MYTSCRSIEVNPPYPQEKIKTLVLEIDTGGQVKNFKGRQLTLSRKFSKKPVILGEGVLPHKQDTVISPSQGSISFMCSSLPCPWNTIPPSSSVSFFSQQPIIGKCFALSCNATSNLKIKYYYMNVTQTSHQHSCHPLA